MRQSTAALGEALAAFDRGDDRHDIWKSAHGSHVFIDAIVAHAVLESEPGDVFRGQTKWFSGLVANSTARLGNQKRGALLN